MHVICGHPLEDFVVASAVTAFHAGQQMDADDVAELLDRLTGLPD